ncbi:MAG: 3-dehydroquinate synthase, partial [Flavobacteriaceae bacterium]
AIASGLIIELYISHLTLGFPLEKVELCTKHINNLFPKIKLTENEIIKLYQLMKFDKKNYKDNTNFVLLKDIGSCVIDQTAIKDSIDAGINYYLNN